MLRDRFLQDDASRKVTDLPPEVLKCILASVEGIEQLQTRHDFSLVSKSFAAAVRQITCVTMSSQNLISTGRIFSIATQERLSVTLAHVTQLELHDVHGSNYSQMFRVVRSCQQLRHLQMQLRSTPTTLLTERPLYMQLWDLFNRPSAMLPHLQQLEVTSPDLVYLQTASTGTILWQQEGLANIIAGCLDMLTGLASCALGVLLDVSPCNEKTDSAILSLMPALQTIDIGEHPLHVPFHGTVRGKLTSTTAPTFQQAKVAHCTGCLGRMADVQDIDSIKTWISEQEDDAGVISRLAPKLEVLRLRVLGPYVKLTSLFLTPWLTVIDIAYSLYVHLCGLPHASMQSLRVESPNICIEWSLWEWLQNAFSANFSLSGGTVHTGLSTPQDGVLICQNDLRSAVLRCQRV